VPNTDLKMVLLIANAYSSNVKEKRLVLPCAAMAHKKQVNSYGAKLSNVPIDVLSIASLGGSSCCFSFKSSHYKLKISTNVFLKIIAL